MQVQNNSKSCNLSMAERIGTQFKGTEAWAFYEIVALKVIKLCQFIKPK